jgi:hypothetical protein
VLNVYQLGGLSGLIFGPRRRVELLNNTPLVALHRTRRYALVNPSLLVSYMPLAARARARRHFCPSAQIRTSELSLAPHQFRGSALEAWEHRCAAGAWTIALSQLRSVCAPRHIGRKK